MALKHNLCLRSRASLLAICAIVAAGLVMPAAARRELKFVGGGQPDIRSIIGGSFGNIAVAVQKAQELNWQKYQCYYGRVLVKSLIRDAHDTGVPYIFSQCPRNMKDINGVNIEQPCEQVATLVAQCMFNQAPFVSSQEERSNLVQGCLSEVLIDLTGVDNGLDITRYNRVTGVPRRLVGFARMVIPQFGAYLIEESRDILKTVTQNDGLRELILSSVDGESCALNESLNDQYKTNAYPAPDGVKAACLKPESPCVDP